MDDLQNWRRKIGCFRPGGPKPRWRLDPYGGRKVLTWGETFFGSLCFLAVVLTAYTCIEDGYSGEFQKLLRCHGVGESSDWRRRRGWKCDEDLVGGRLTLGSVWVVSAFSAWGVHELYRRLKLMWASDIEKNPGPLPKEASETPEYDARPLPQRSTEQPLIPAEQTVSSYTDSVTRGDLGQSTTEGVCTRGKTLGESIAASSSSGSGTSGTSASGMPDKSEDARVTLGNRGTGESGAGEAGDTLRHSHVEKPHAQGSVSTLVKAFSTPVKAGKAETGETVPKGQSTVKGQKSTLTSSLIGQLGREKEKVVSKQNSGLEERKKKMNKKASESGEEGVCEGEQRGGKGGKGGGGGVSGDSGASVSVSVAHTVSEDLDTFGEDGNDVLNDSMKTMLNVSCEVEEFARRHVVDSEDEVSEKESEEEESSDETSDNVKESKKRRDKARQRKDDNDKSRAGKRTKTKTDRGVLSFVKDQMQSMVGAIQKLTTELKTGQEDVKRKQEDISRGQEEMRRGQDDMRRGQEDLKREMREEIRGLQRKQEEQGKHLEQVLEKVEDTQEKIEGLRGDIQKTQEEVRKNRADIQELKQNQEEAREEAGKQHQDLAQEFDRLDSNSRRNNLKFFGIPEEGKGQREDTEGVMLRLLNKFIPEGGWKREHLEKAQRLGRRREDEEDSKPRPVLALFFRAGDARRILANKQARTELRNRGVQISQDLTQRQQQQLRDLKNTGQRGYFFRGNLVIQGENDRGGRGGRGWWGRGGVRGGPRGARGGSNLRFG